jgi:hypothetical protein
VAADLGTTNATLATKEWHFSLEEGLQAEPPRAGRAATGPVVITARERARLEAFVPDDAEPQHTLPPRQKGTKGVSSALRGALLSGGLLAALGLLTISSPKALGRMLSAARVAPASMLPATALPDLADKKPVPESKLGQAVVPAVPPEASPEPQPTSVETQPAPTAIVALPRSSNDANQAPPPTVDNAGDVSAASASKVGSQARAVDHLAKGELRKARIEYAILAHENPNAEVYKTLHRLLSERVKQACRYSADPQRCEDGP